MFSLKDKLTFININQDYLKYLHEQCPEVYYKPINYDNKPYLGILITNDGQEYVVPISSAKKKHESWKNIESDRFLIYEKYDRMPDSPDAVCKRLPDGTIEHLLSVIDLKKMIPVKEGLYTRVDLVHSDTDSEEISRINPYGKQFMYSGGGTELAELAFTRITKTTLRDAFQNEIAAPLGLTRTGFFQPLDESLVSNAAFGGRYAYREDPAHGYHYYPEHAAAGLWTTPTELTKLGIALSRSCREGGILRKETARRMVTPVMDGYGLCIKRDDRIPDQVGHTGGNEGFIAYWTLSLTEDLCAAVMFNGSNRLNSAVAGPMFGFLDGLIESEKG